MQRVAMIGLTFVTLFPSLAMAQVEEVKPEWVIPYALVGALIGLGVFGICRPHRRSRKVDAVD